MIWPCSLIDLQCLKVSPLNSVAGLKEVDHDQEVHRF